MIPTVYFRFHYPYLPILLQRLWKLLAYCTYVYGCINITPLLSLEIEILSFVRRCRIEDESFLQMVLGRIKIVI